MKRTILLLGFLFLTILSVTIYVKATAYVGDVAYVIYDEEGNEIDNGVISSNMSRASFTAVTLKDGEMAKFTPNNTVGFLTLSNRIIKFAYSMNKSGYMTTQLYRYRSVRVAKNQSTHKGTTLKYTTTTEGYYYALITNDSGSDKNIYGITFETLMP